MERIFLLLFCASECDIMNKETRQKGWHSINEPSFFGNAKENKDRKRAFAASAGG